MRAGQLRYRLTLQQPSTTEASGFADVATVAADLRFQPAPSDIEALRRRRAGQRFAFLTELAPQAHAPIYAAAMGAPLGGFASRPAAPVQENAAQQVATYEAMVAAGRLVRPS